MLPSAGYLIGYAFAVGVIGLLIGALAQRNAQAERRLSALVASVLGGGGVFARPGHCRAGADSANAAGKAFLLDLAFVPGDLAKAVLCAIVVHTVAEALPDSAAGWRSHMSGLRPMRPMPPTTAPISAPVPPAWRLSPRLHRALGPGAAQAVALASECEQLTFAQLHQRVRRRRRNGGNRRASRPRPPCCCRCTWGWSRDWCSFWPCWPVAVVRPLAMRPGPRPLPIGAGGGGRFVPYRAAARDLMPFYIGFTSGSSGQPKGFRRHHRSWVESLPSPPKPLGAAPPARCSAPGRISHSLFLFAAMLGLWTGRGARVQEKFSAETTWAQLQQAPAAPWWPCPANCCC